jgi:hypothetical protein
MSIIKFGDSIPHFEDLSLKKLKTLQTEPGQFFISEKLDGLFFQIGREDKDAPLYVSTKKGEKYFSIQDIPDVYYLKDIKRVCKNIFEINKKFPPHQFLLNGELIPSYNHNIIQYNKEKIREGLFVCFEKLFVYDDTYKQLQSSSKHLIFSTPKQFQFDWKEGEYFFDSEFTRLVLDSKNKEKLLTPIKQNILKKFLDWYFNLKAEGIVVRYECDNFTVDPFSFKMIDKDKFLKEKKINWRQIEELKSKESQIRKSTNINIDLLLDYYIWLRKYEINESEFTLPRKLEDTKEHLKWNLEKAEKALEWLNKNKHLSNDDILLAVKEHIIL